MLISGLALLGYVRSCVPECRLGLAAFASKQIPLPAVQTIVIVLSFTFPKKCAKVAEIINGPTYSLSQTSRFSRSSPDALPSLAELGPSTISHKHFRVDILVVPAINRGYLRKKIPSSRGEIRHGGGCDE